MIEVAHAGLKLMQGSTVARTAVPAPLTTPTKSKAASPTEDLAEQTPEKGLAPHVASQPTMAEPTTITATAPAATKRAVADLLRREAEGKEAGLHIDAVCAAVNGDAASVRAALEALVEDGDVYTTINDDHFAPLV